MVGVTIKGNSYSTYIFAIRAEDTSGAANAITNYLALDKFRNDVKPVGSTTITTIC